MGKLNSKIESSLKWIMFKFRGTTVDRLINVLLNICTYMNILFKENREIIIEPKDAQTLLDFYSFKFSTVPHLIKNNLCPVNTILLSKFSHYNIIITIL